MYAYNYHRAASAQLHTGVRAHSEGARMYRNCLRLPCGWRWPGRRQGEDLSSSLTPRSRLVFDERLSNHICCWSGSGDVRNFGDVAIGARGGSCGGCRTPRRPSPAWCGGVSLRPGCWAGKQRSQPAIEVHASSGTLAVDVWTLASGRFREAQEPLSLSPCPTMQGACS